MKQLLAATWAEAQQNVSAAGTVAWGSTTITLPEMAGKVIYVALSILGLIFLGHALYAGFKWMTAQGDEKQVTAAKDTIKNAVIGMIIIVAAYSITAFVMGQLESISNGATPAPINGELPSPAAVGNVTA